MAVLGALLLAGCATTSNERLSYVCSSKLSDGLHAASSIRLLDWQGNYRSGHTEWFRAQGSDSVDAHARWDDPDLPQTDRASYTFRIVTNAFPTEGGQVRLYSDAGTVNSAFGTGTLRQIRVNGRQLASLRGTEESLGIAAFNRRDELMGGSGITWADLDRGLELARQANARSLAASTDYRRLCQREQRIIVT
jgi:hypothetical protein